ncbi:hypothetical protein ACFCZ1_08805 [Streptomyces sp. NPDC056224]|uniref:hypothetical protein n=1 Tax=Streptomyces sp. NPDC056224 TaxID=3345750 RepID=UPI0035D9F962
MKDEATARPARGRSPRAGIGGCARRRPGRPGVPRLPGGAVEIRADGVSATRLHDALIADPEARERLGGGSVALDGELILVAPLDDLGLARRFTADLGVDWDTAHVRYGEEEFVA